LINKWLSSFIRMEHDDQMSLVMIEIMDSIRGRASSWGAPYGKKNKSC
jgi:hypothetical protein